MSIAEAPEPVDLLHAAIIALTARHDTSDGLVAREQLVPLVAAMVAEIGVLRDTVTARREDAEDAPLARLNRALAELGMPAAVLTVETGREPSGWPVAVVRLVHADDPKAAYGTIRIPFRDKEDGRDE